MSSNAIEAIAHAACAQESEVVVDLRGNGGVPIDVWKIFAKHDRVILGSWHFLIESHVLESQLVELKKSEPSPEPRYCSWCLKPTECVPYDSDVKLSVNVLVCSRCAGWITPCPHPCRHFAKLASSDEGTSDTPMCSLCAGDLLHWPFDDGSNDAIQITTSLEADELVVKTFHAEGRRPEDESDSDSDDGGEVSLHAASQVSPPVNPIMPVLPPEAISAVDAEEISSSDDELDVPDVARRRIDDMMMTRAVGKSRLPCPWCQSPDVQRISDEFMFRRAVFLCARCNHKSLPCRLCDESLTKSGQYWDDEFCKSCFR